MSHRHDQSALAIVTMNVLSRTGRKACGCLVVHSLDAQNALFSSSKALLDDGERARAERFVFDRDRFRYVIAHAQLRRVLASELALEPSELRFESGEQGKPEIVREQNPKQLRFNLSHSGDLAMIGWTYGRAIGVDIEVMRPRLAEEGIARRYFSARECSEWLDVEPEARTRAFFNCWTRKEAFIKAVGRGLSYPLLSFDVSLAPGHPVAIHEVREAQERSTVWGIAAFEPRDDAVAAVVIEGIEAPVLEPAPR